MAKKEPAINFYQGHICIRDEDGNLIFQDDSCIPILREKIDIFIESNQNVLSAKDIIYPIIKEYFGIKKTFITPNETSCIPSNDPLYNLLVKQILTNELYNNRLKTKKLHMLERKKAYVSYIEKNAPYAGFEKDRKKYFAKRRH